jgi:GTP:adenosylcobinamide-phosphate guanylyltransferase
MSKLFSAIVLAGDRTKADPLLELTGAGSKSLIELGGEPMLLRVLRALKKSAVIAEIIVSGPSAKLREGQQAINAVFESGDASWQAPQATPSTSAYHALQQVPKDSAVLLTTTDHIYLNEEILSHFCNESVETGADVTVGLAPYALVKEAFPEMKKTVSRFKEGEFCGCNLFAFLTPEGRKAADLWRQVEAQRKSPLRIIKLLGWRAVLEYSLGILTLERAMKLLSKRFGLKLAAVILPYAEAAIDVDSVDDYEVIKKRFDQEAGTNLRPSSSRRACPRM